MREHRGVGAGEAVRLLTVYTARQGGGGGELASGRPEGGPRFASCAAGGKKGKTNKQTKEKAAPGAGVGEGADLPVGGGSC